MKKKIYEKESFRIPKVESEVRNVIASYVQFHSKNPSLGSHVSIVSTNVSKDLRSIKVIYSLLSIHDFDATNEEHVKEIGNALKLVRGELAGYVAREMNFRLAPKLQFIHQTSFDPTIEDLFTLIKRK